jgi:hypothetical protein
MMNIVKLFFGEHSLSKVAASYDSESAAMSAARAVECLPHMYSRQVQLVHPQDKDWGRKLEPEAAGIWRTAVRSHVTCATVGFAAGTLLFAALMLGGVEAVRSTPGMSLVAMVLFGTMFGLMVGGLLTIRPDHEAVIAPVREGVKAGRWAVVVHPASRQQFAAVLRVLRGTEAPVATTL